MKRHGTDIVLRLAGGPPALGGVSLPHIAACQKIILFSGAALCNITNQQIWPEISKISNSSQRRVRNLPRVIGD
jgi:hypothetical protein